MGRVAETLRKSSFFNTYGPGAIYETSIGHTAVVQIFIPDTSLVVNDRFITNFLATRLREAKHKEGMDAEKFRPDNIKIFIIRDYNERGEPAFKIKAKRYFKWFLVSPEFREDAVYLVNSLDLKDLEKKVGKIKIISNVRFIGICEQGHMQDIPWDKVVHGGGKKCSNRIFKWKEEKGDIAGGLEIICPECNAKAGLKDIYDAYILCGGYVAEKGGEQESCRSRLKVTLKTASDVYIPETLIFVSVHPFASEKYRILIEDDELRGKTEAYKKLQESMPNEIKKIAQLVYEELTKKLDEDKVRGLYGATPEEVMNVLLNEVFPEVNKYLSLTGTGEHDVKRLEFETFYKACKQGYPPVRDMKGHYHLLINSNKKKIYDGVIFQPIEKLTFYRILLGYRRTSPSARLVPTYAFLNGEYWFPASSHITEGIFISFTEDKLKDLFKIAEKSELFAFLHTLSHAVIRFFGEVSGYSEASLRERVYFFPEEQKAGILIFALSESGDGAAGGLTSSITVETNVENLIRYVQNRTSFCSRDPVCFEAVMEVEEPFYGTLHGFLRNESVCHACMLISETSCELANKGLSRKVLQKYMSILHGRQ